MNNKSENINELALALAKAQGQIEGAHKDSKNPFFKSSYADLASVWDACREPLAKNGLAVIQTTESNIEFDKTWLITTLVHSSGQWISGTYLLTPKVNDPQGMGSAMSYARRYCLAAMVGVFQVDDDANMASGKHIEPPKLPAEEKAKIVQTLNKNLKQAVAVAHEHAWRNSQYTNEMEEEMEYCTICKFKRPRPKADIN